MIEIRIPEGLKWEHLAKHHPRRQFSSGEPAVDDWLRTNALQHHLKRLSTTTVLLAPAGPIVGYYTIVTSQVDFGDLPVDIAKSLPKRPLPVALLAWLGVDSGFHGQGLGERLVSKALRDCYEAGQIFAVVAVMVDCLNDSVKDFYRRWDFRESPGRPLRLYLSTAELTAMMTGKE